MAADLRQPAPMVEAGGGRWAGLRLNEGWEVRREMWELDGKLGGIGGVIDVRERGEGGSWSSGVGMIQDLRQG